MAPQLAREGHAFFRVETSAVFREYELPAGLVGPGFSAEDKRRWQELKDLAEIHRTGIQPSPYRVG